MEPTAPPPQHSPNGATPEPDEREKRPPRLLFLVRHGQSAFNVEGRLPGQMEGVALTDEGRRQAYRAAVALSGVPLSAVVSSPLERALDTAKAIAKGGALEIQQEPGLMDTDVGRWTGMKIDDVKKNDPAWNAFIERPDQPPEGVEGLVQVQERAIAVVERILASSELGNFVAVVSHADIVKVILAHYMHIHFDTTLRHMYIGNASISALAFHQNEPTPTMLAVNWSPAPEWLAPRPTEPAPAANRIEGEATAENAESKTSALAGEQPHP
jgi:probable phosphoglycerate mutase